MSDLVLADKHSLRLRRMRRGVLASAKAINNDLERSGFEKWDEESFKRWGSAGAMQYRCALITLTYHPDVEWTPRHVTDLCAHYKKWAKRNKVQFSYVWTIETHESGRPHYHVVIWVTGGKTPPFPDEQGWWPHGKTNAVWAHSPVGYIAKYASKGHKYALPEGCRLWGAGGLTPEARAEKSWACAPKWVRQVTSPNTLVRRAVTAITETYSSGKTAVFNVVAWVCSETRFAFFSPWEYAHGSPNGMSLRHKGYIEAFSPEGDFFKIRHENPMELHA